MTKEEEKYTTLDTEQCKWWVNNLFGMAKEKACNSHNFDDGEEIQAAQDKIIKALEMAEEFEKEQVKVIDSSEIDIQKFTEAMRHQPLQAVNHLSEQVIRPCEDCVSRQALLEFVESKYQSNWWNVDEVLTKIKTMPPVTPTFPKCTTNGEVIIRAFPNLKYNIQNGRAVTTIGVASSFDLDWWNTPYKRGNENDNT